MPTDLITNLRNISQDTAIGIGLPLFGDYGSRFNSTYSTIDQAAANAKNLLLTNSGERVMLPNFGCDLNRSLFNNLSEFTTDEIVDKIEAQFSYWLPYININKLDVFYNNEDPTAVNKIYISMVISLKNNQIDTRSIDLTITQA